MNQLGEAMRLEGLRKENIRAWGEVGRLKAELDAANSRSARMVEALQWISDHYANQDLSHVRFRVEAKELADAALSTGAGEEKHG